MSFPKAALGVIVAVVLGACGGSENGNGGDILASAPPTSTEPTTTVPVTTIIPTTTTIPAAALATAARSTTLRPPIRAAVPVTTTLRPTTTRPPVATTTTAVGPPQCSAAQLSVDVTTDKASYRPGETVKALATLRNSSGAPCLYGNYGFSTRFSGPLGQMVGIASMGHTDGFGPMGTFAPGQTMTQDPTFDQRSCGDPCFQEPPGTYRVIAEWFFSGPTIAGSSTFRLVAA